MTAKLNSLNAELATVRRAITVRGFNADDAELTRLIIRRDELNAEIKALNVPAPEASYADMLDMLHR